MGVTHKINVRIELPLYYPQPAIEVEQLCHCKANDEFEASSLIIIVILITLYYIIGNI